jgi:tetratricopeptide (TPR) repeat protein
LNQLHKNNVGSRIYPDDVESLRGFAIASYFAGHPERAIIAQRRALALSPNDPGCYDYLIELLIRTNQFSEALTVYRQAQSRKLDTLSFRFLAAVAAWGNGDLQSAQRLLDIPAGQSDDYADAVSRLYQGKLLAYQGRFYEATETFRSGLALVRRPGLEDWSRIFQYQLARTEMLRGDSLARKVECRRYADLVKVLPSTGNLQRAGRLLVKIGDLAAAREFKRLIEKQLSIHPNSFSDMELRSLEGEIDLAYGQTDKAIENQRNALNILKSYEPFLSLGEACAQSKNWTCAIEAYTQYLQLKGEILRDDVAADWVIAHYSLARIYFLSGDRQRALDYDRQFLDMFAAADADLPIVVTAKRDLARWNDTN